RNHWLCLGIRRLLLRDHGCAVYCHGFDSSEKSIPEREPFALCSSPSYVEVVSYQKSNAEKIPRSLVDAGGKIDPGRYRRLPAFRAAAIDFWVRAAPAEKPRNARR